MKKGKLVLLVILTLLLLVFPFITGCVPKKSSSTPANTNPSTNTNSEITSLERRISQIESTTSSIQNQLNNIQNNAGKNYDGEISNLQSQDSNINQKLNSIESTLSNIQDQLDQLEEVQEAEEEGYTTKWYPEISTNITDNVSVTLSSPRIEDEGSYRMTIVANNTSAEAIKNVIIEVYLTPRSGDHVYLDSSDTFMDSVGSPFIWWDTEIRERGSDDYAGAIICDSEYITLPPGETIFKTEFTLTYASE